MNTPAHLIFATAAFARPYDRGRTLAAVAGALTPDLSLYLMSFTALFVFGYSPQHVFDVLYFSPAWQQVFAIDNSFILWGLAFGLSAYLGAKNAMVFTASALLHLAFDFPLHHDDARAHFWPVSDWVFESPLSYWDPDHFGGVISMLEIGVSLMLCVVLFYRFQSARSRSLVAVLAMTQVMPLVMWAYIFSGAT
ncbi:cobalamin biosynthesis protein CobQ [Roseovarius sp. EL26]|uniref:cobalamin biosynthesis protein CobQ n=1 Tax=Roseovarius sp. EL26 TaxID=2126672 RepID=UPI000EA2187A|nr:cobalamin biosynthesis protein CobQ [Roseovarius sp. EL26]